MKNKNVAVVGLWHLGCVYATSLAKLGFNVFGFDIDKNLIKNLNKGITPIFEPDLDELLKKHINKNLIFSTEEKILRDKDYIFITYDVEVDNKDTSDMSIIKKLFKIVAANVSSRTVIVISSQIPVGTSRTLINVLKKKGWKNPKVVYFPENLKLGQAFSSFLEPDRIILGSDNSEELKQFERNFSFNCPIITMGLESAEMVKHALNSYLALCISWSSELSDISEKVGADMTDVVKALKSDKRVSPHASLNPGLGFGGGTLGRDVQSLRKIAKETNTASKLLDAVYAVNKGRLPMLLKKIMIPNFSLRGKTIGILGLTYKPKTDTLRRSMSLELAVLLKAKGCIIKAFDPAIKKPIASSPFIEVCTKLPNFFRKLDMVVLMTDWDEFKEINPQTIAPLMNKAVIVDTKNFLPADLYRKNGFTYIGMGIQ